MHPRRRFSRNDMEIKDIRLKNVLPDVFADIAGASHIASSEIWLSEVKLQRGANYLVYAESGTGKSSLCSYLYGERRDYSGRILFDSADISRFGQGRWSELRQKSLAYLPQQLSLFPELTVTENIEIKNRLTNFRSATEIGAMLERMEIADKAEVRARYLSIGQQQRVAIIRALCQPFDFLLLDEPVSHLDARNNVSVAEMISEEATRQGASIIATSVGNNISIRDFVTLHL